MAFRLEQAEKVGLGFDLPSQTHDVVRIVRIVRKNEVAVTVETVQPVAIPANVFFFFC